MKKISVISILSVLVMPAFAEKNVTTVANAAADASVVEQYSQQFQQPSVKQINKYSNPETKFPHGLQLGIGVSPTSGLNAFIGYNNKSFESFWWKRFGFRLDFAIYSPIKNKLNTEINEGIGNEGYKVSDNIKLKDFELDAKHIGAIIDFYPFGDTWLLGGWRLSGGYMTGKLDLNAAFYGYEKFGKTGFVINDYFYYYSDNMLRGHALASWKYSGPYLGTGFDLGIFHGLKLYFDAGVVFTGNTPDLNVDIPLDGLKNSSGVDITKDSTDPAVQAAYALFEENKEAALVEARNEVKDYKYYPMVKMGLMYRF